MAGVESKRAVEKWILTDGGLEFCSRINGKAKLKAYVVEENVRTALS